MTTPPDPIVAAPPEAPDRDYDTLYAAAVSRVSELAAPAWSDHNAADPGITLLQAALLGPGRRCTTERRSAASTPGRSPERPRTLISATPTRAESVAEALEPPRARRQSRWPGISPGDVMERDQPA